MKAPILRASFFSTHLSGSKSLTSAANFTENFSGSNFWMKSTPLWPRNRASQVSLTVCPTGVTRPRPVTTTRRFKCLFLPRTSSARPPNTSGRAARACGGGLTDARAEARLCAPSRKPPVGRWARRRRGTYCLLFALDLFERSRTL